jgi:hypothetical protein
MDGSHDPVIPPASLSAFELRPLKRSLEDVVADDTASSKRIRTDSGSISEDTDLEDAASAIDEDELPSSPFRNREPFSPPTPPPSTQSTALVLYSGPGPGMNPTTGLPDLPNRILLSPLPPPMPAVTRRTMMMEPSMDWRSGAGQLVLWTPPEDVVKRALEADKSSAGTGRRKSTDSSDNVDMELD